jgi:hypothetical protein
MSIQNVFIFWASPLFYESLVRTLIHPNIKLVGATSDYTTISVDIANTKPNTIIIENVSKHHSAMVRDILDTFPWTIKIILLSFKDTKLGVYHHEQRSMMQTDDLLQLILSELR